MKKMRAFKTTFEEEQKLAVVFGDNDFIADVEAMVEAGADGYIDSILECCARRGIDTDQVTALIKKSKQLKGKLQNEARRLRFLK
jgi:hypothetical protein